MGATKSIACGGEGLGWAREETNTPRRKNEERIPAASVVGAFVVERVHARTEARDGAGVLSCERGFVSGEAYEHSALGVAQRPSELATRDCAVLGKRIADGRLVDVLHVPIRVAKQEEAESAIVALRARREPLNL